MVPLCAMMLFFMILDIFNVSDEVRNIPGLTFIDTIMFLVSLMLMLSSYSKRFNTVKYLYHAFCLFLVANIFNSLRFAVTRSQMQIIALSNQNVQWNMMQLIVSISIKFTFKHGKFNFILIMLSFISLNTTVAIHLHHENELFKSLGTEVEKLNQLLFSAVFG